MNRDPFNLRSSSSPALNILRNGANTVQRTATQASQRIVTAIGDTIEETPKEKKSDEWPDFQEDESSSASTMSYGLPQNGPTQRHPDQWSRAGQDGHGHGHAEGISEKVTNMFNPERRDSLPMYKDKPYGYPGTSRRSAFRKKRTVGIALATMAGLSWWFGVLSPLSYFSSGDESTTSSSSWSLFGASKPKVDWDGRAKSVREAFQLSWAGYEKYAWGKFCM